MWKIKMMERGRKVVEEKRQKIKENNFLCFSLIDA
jgi:hypothetical protein